MKKNVLESILVLLVIVWLVSCNKDYTDTPVATSVSLLSEESMQGVAGQQLTDSIVVLVKDQYDHPMKDVALNCFITEGALTNAHPVTNRDGMASFCWKLGPSESQILNIYLRGANGGNIPELQIVINATAGLPVVTDIDGNEYNTVRIGNQVWMKENLRTTKYPDGLPISLVENTEAWASLTETDKAFCFYNNDENTDVNYGLLYTWAAATNGEGFSDSNPSGIQGICPPGWHIPSSAEWDQLHEYLGGRDSDAGGKMKETGYDHWLSPNDGATNSSGFMALPAGFRDEEGKFHGLGVNANLWSTSIYSLPHGPNSVVLISETPDFYGSGGNYFNMGFSVRCIMDNK